MLIRDTKSVYRCEVTKALGKDATGEQVLDHLLGRYGDNDSGVNFVIREWRYDDRTPVQRANMFWAIPLTIMCAPYQYVVKGQVGWDTKTRFGRWILRVTGHLHDE